MSLPSTIICWTPSRTWFFSTTGAAAPQRSSPLVSALHSTNWEARSLKANNWHALEPASRVCNGSPTRDALEGYLAGIRFVFPASGHVRLRRTYRLSCPHAKRPCRRTRLAFSRGLHRRVGLFSTLARPARRTTRYVPGLGSLRELGRNPCGRVLHFALFPHGFRNRRALSPLWELVVDSIHLLRSGRGCRRYPCAQRLQTDPHDLEDGLLALGFVHCECRCHGLDKVRNHLAVCALWCRR